MALVPGRVTINPEEVDSSVELGSLRLAIPILAAAMDGTYMTKKVRVRCGRCSTVNVAITEAQP